MNIFLHELKSNSKSTAIWIASISLIMICFLSLYPSFMKDVDATRKLLASLPPAVRAAAGINLEIFFSITGFYSYLFFYALLSGSVQAMNLGVSMLSRESALKTVDFLLTKPVTRAKIITSKSLAALLLILVTNIVVIGAALATVGIVTSEQFSMKIFLLISATLLLVQLFFLGMGLMASVLISNIKSVLSVSLPVVFTFFIIGMLDSIIGIQTVRYFTPFKFFDVIYIMKHGSYEAKFLGLELVLICAFIAATFIVFTKKDIPASS